MNSIQPNHRDHNDTGFTYPKFKWNGDKCQTFTEHLKYLILHCKQNVHDLIDNDVNDAVNCITSLYQDAASCMRVYGNSSCTSNNQPVWWDVECDTLKSSKYRDLRRFRITNDVEDLIFYKEINYLRVPFLKRCPTFRI